MAGLLGDVEHHQPAMTASLLKRFCRTSRTLPQVRGDGRRNDGFPPQPPQSGACSLLPLTDQLRPAQTKGTDPRPPELTPSPSPPVDMAHGRAAWRGRAWLEG